MKKEKIARTYTLLSRAWYSNILPKDEDFYDEISLEIGNAMDITFHFYRNSRGKSIVRLEMFNDTWEAFSLLPKLFLEVLPRCHTASGEDSISPEELCALLDNLGFTDVTKTKRER